MSVEQVSNCLQVNKTEEKQVVTGKGVWFFFFPSSLMALYSSLGGKKKKRHVSLQTSLNLYYSGD